MKIFILVQLLLTVDAFKVGEICLKSQNKCTGSFSSSQMYSVQCAGECIGDHRTVCGSDYCTKDEAACKSKLFIY